MTARARHRLHFRRFAAVGQAETIAIDENIPFNATLLQWHVHWSAIPTTDEAIDVYKNTLPAGYSVHLYSINPWEDTISEYIDHQNWEFIRGDHLWVSYPNTDDLGVNVEFIFGGAK